MYPIVQKFLKVKNRPASFEDIRLVRNTRKKWRGDQPPEVLRARRLSSLLFYLHVPARSVYVDIYGCLFCFLLWRHACRIAACATIPQPAYH